MPPKRATKSRPKMLPSVERTIHFFRAVGAMAPAGRPLPVDVAATLTRLNGLPWSPTPVGRYVTLPDGDFLCGVVDATAPRPRMQLAVSRRTSLPSLENAGTLSPLSLPANAGLYEAIHVSFFPDNIAGVVFNFYGPRASRLPSYLRQVAPGIAPIFKLEALLRRDVSDQLARLDSVKVLELEIRKSYAAQVRAANKSLGDALTAATQVGNPEVVGLILRPEPYKRHMLGQTVLNAVRRLAGRGDLRENTLRFNIRGRNPETGRIEDIDVLKDLLVSTRRIVRQDQSSRTLNPASAYQALDEAFEELRADLQESAGIS